MKILDELHLAVDIAPTACEFAQSDAEKAIVETNAKLMLIPQYKDHNMIDFGVGATDGSSLTQIEGVDELLDKLKNIYGFKIVHRNPVTSAGCPMNDRVILKLEKP